MSTNNSQLHNFADDNTVISSSSKLSQLIKIYKVKQIRPEIGLGWTNNLIVIPNNFQGIMTDKSKTITLQKYILMKKNLF